ncbi:hypothetical protein QA640_12230 [Bradyrhizobium sp. CB82]|uniref:hypothetical protein n=1 Tax=Bradyrhizobium sp. CB82 TaxID=3039159 RepID=UPI0024B0788A|nr:hypothetical protein [Bradyrhizobium sp. CB82]WFU43141.1 hypothetical protein QA640_12230 [Bradyrhizobium sp. CB82]
MSNRLISIICGSALIVATSAAVFAADMAVKALPSAPPPAKWDWSGFYIGVGGSYNWTHFDQSLQGVSGGDVPIAVELRRADVAGMNVTRPS